MYVLTRIAFGCAGEMSRLSNEQKRIEELQSVMNTTKPQSRSTPRNKSSFTERTPTITHTSNTTSMRDETILERRLSDLDKTPGGANSELLAQGEYNSALLDLGADDSQSLALSKLDSKLLASGGDNSQSNISTSQALAQQPVVSQISMSKSLLVEADRFSEPSSHSMSHSTDEPFILHSFPSTKVNKSAERKKTKAAGKSSPKPAAKTNSNGFLSSSQLSRKKVS